MQVVDLKHIKLTISIAYKEYLDVTKMLRIVLGI